MKKLIMMLFVAVLFSTAALAGQKEDCLEKFKATREAFVDVRYNNAEWYIVPGVWTGLTYPQKEDILMGLSQCREVLNGNGRIVIKDGKSGEVLGKAGAMGPKIYK